MRIVFDEYNKKAGGPIIGQFSKTGLKLKGYVQIIVDKSISFQSISAQQLKLCMYLLYAINLFLRNNHMLP